MFPSCACKRKPPWPSFFHFWCLYIHIFIISLQETVHKLSQICLCKRLLLLLLVTRGLPNLYSCWNSLAHRVVNVAKKHSHVDIGQTLRHIKAQCFASDSFQIVNSRHMATYTEKKAARVYRAPQIALAHQQSLQNPGIQWKRTYHALSISVMHKEPVEEHSKGSGISCYENIMKADESMVFVLNVIDPIESAMFWNHGASTQDRSPYLLQTRHVLCISLRLGSGTSTPTAATPPAMTSKYLWSWQSEQTQSTPTKSGAELFSVYNRCASRCFKALNSKVNIFPMTGRLSS